MGHTRDSRAWKFGFREAVCAAVIVVVFASMAIPNQLGGGRANGSAAIATLKNIYAAQEQLQASGAIDCDGDGVGEFGYFGELSGGVAVRTARHSSERETLTPPVLSGAFANVATHTGIAGGVVTRSGYVFQVFLPNRIGNGVPEANTGGVGEDHPDPDRSERYWCCYAWPSTVYSDGNRRAFFVDQTGHVLVCANESPSYLNGRAPSFDAAFQVGGAWGKTGSVSGGEKCNDGQDWRPVE